jgi:hypothetical protein
MGIFSAEAFFCTRRIPQLGEGNQAKNKSGAVSHPVILIIHKLHCILKDALRFIDLIISYSGGANGSKSESWFLYGTKI